MQLRGDCADMNRSSLVEQYGPILLDGLIESELAKAEQLHAAGLGPPAAESNSVILLKRYGKEALQVLRGVMLADERKSHTHKIALIADLASRFCQGAVEITESDDELRNLARRSVRLARHIVAEAALTVERDEAKP